MVIFVLPWQKKSQSHVASQVVAAGWRSLKPAAGLMPGITIVWPKSYNFMADSKRIPVEGGPGLAQNPFAALSSDGLPPGPEHPLVEAASVAKPAKKSRGRVDILRVKAGRGGKTVTVVKNFVGIGLPEKEQLAKAMQRACGTGGTVKNGQIEIQGDKREEAARILREANFQPVFAGG